MKIKFLIFTLLFGLNILAALDLETKKVIGQIDEMLLEGLETKITALEKQRDEIYDLLAELETNRANSKNEEEIKKYDNDIKINNQKFEEISKKLLRLVLDRFYIEQGR